MKILLDARYLKYDYTGIGNYSRDLMEAIGRIDSRNTYTVLVHESFKGELELPENFELVAHPSPPISISTVLTIGSSYSHYNPDVVHSIMPLCPVNWRGKSLVTVFDLQAVTDPYFTSGRWWLLRKAYDLFYRYFYRRSFRNADYLLCISYATKHEVIRMYPEFADKILVVHAGIDEDARSLPIPETISRVEDNYDLPERFVMYLGSTRPNKNLWRMVDAFAEFISQNPEQDDLHLVMILNPDRFFDPLFTSIRERGLLRRIRIYEQVSESEKKVFYHRAELLYFVTKFEGFGLPVLEAQALGCPVMCSTHGSLPEVAGNDALFADPDSTESIVAAFKRFYSTPGLRDAMIAEGFENLERFRWERAAREVVDMYEHVLS